MAFNLKSLFVIYISVLGLTSGAFMKFPDDYTNAGSLQELTRPKRTVTTFCVQIRPRSSLEEPYFMCKGTEDPRLNNELPNFGMPSENNAYRNINEAKTRAEELVPDQYAGFRAPFEQHARQEPLWQPTGRQFFPLEAEFFPETPDQSFQSYPKIAPKTRYNPQFPGVYEKASPVSSRAFVPPYTFGHEFNDKFSTPAALAQNDLAYQAHFNTFGRNEGFGTYEKTSRPDAQIFESDLLPLNNKGLRKSTTNFYGNNNALQYDEIPNDLLKFKFAQDITGNALDLQNVPELPTIPAEYMNDPILRAFYKSLLETNTPPILTVEAPVITTTPLPKTSTPLTTEIKDEVDTTTIKPTDNNVGQSHAYQNVNNCPRQDNNWPPVVIAMPCFAPMTNQNASPQLAFGYFPNLMSLMTPMAPINYMQGSTINPQFTANYVQERAAVNNYKMDTTIMPEVKEDGDLMADDDNESAEITTSALSTIVETATASNWNMDSSSRGLPKEEMTLSTEPSLGASLTDGTTTLVGFETTEQLDTKDNTQTTFKAMLSRAKKFKELSDKGVPPEQVVFNYRKGKRQNTRDVHNAQNGNNDDSNKRKYASMLR